MICLVAIGARLPANMPPMAWTAVRRLLTAITANVQASGGSVSVVLRSRHTM